MPTGEFKFEPQHALCQNEADALPQYGSAYLCTNEPLDKYQSMMPIKGNCILTVAASGDQPLMFAANDAVHIDTFDLTYNARVIMDFKTAAIQVLSHDDYADCLHELNTTDAIKPSKFHHVLARMSAPQRAVMRNIMQFRPTAFLKQLLAIFPSNEQTYQHLQQTVPTHFNFIWADLFNLHHYLTSQYDVIYLSNIFDHYIWNGRQTTDIDTTVKNLWSYLRKDGYMFCTTTFPDPRTVAQTCEEFLMTNADVHMPYVKSNLFSPIIIHKER